MYKSIFLQLFNNSCRVLLGRCFASQVPCNPLALCDRLYTGQPVSQKKKSKNKNALTARVAFSILSAWSLRFMCLNIISEDSRSAVGLARPLPTRKQKVNSASASSLHLTYRQYRALTRELLQKWTHPGTLFRVRKLYCRQNRALALPMLPEGVSPNPPIKPAHMSERISPYRLGMTITRSPKDFGFCVIFPVGVSVEVKKRTKHAIHLEADPIKEILVICYFRKFFRNFAARGQEHPIGHFPSYIKPLIDDVTTPSVRT